MNLCLDSTAMKASVTQCLAPCLPYDVERQATAATAVQSALRGMLQRKSTRKRLESTTSIDANDGPSEDSSSCVELFNAMASSLLPGIRSSINQKLVQAILEDEAMLPLGGTPDKPIYTLRVRLSDKAQADNRASIARHKIGGHVLMAGVLWKRGTMFTSKMVRRWCVLTKTHGLLYYTSADEALHEPHAGKPIKSASGDMTFGPQITNFRVTAAETGFHVAAAGKSLYAITLIVKKAERTREGQVRFSERSRDLLAESPREAQEWVHALSNWRSPPSPTAEKKKAAVDHQSDDDEEEESIPSFLSMAVEERANQKAAAREAVTRDEAAREAAAVLAPTYSTPNKARQRPEEDEDDDGEISVIESLSATISNARVHRKPSPRHSPVPTNDDEEEDDDNGSSPLGPSGLPEKLRPYSDEVVCLDVTFSAQVRVVPDVFTCELRGERWFAPTLSAIGLQWIYLQGDVRIWLCVPRQLLFISFLKPPMVSWDLKLPIASLFKGAEPAAMAQADGWLMGAVGQVLSRFNTSKPLHLSLAPKPDVMVYYAKGKGRRTSSVLKRERNLRAALRKARHALAATLSRGGSRRKDSTVSTAPPSRGVSVVSVTSSNDDDGRMSGVRVMDADAPTPLVSPTSTATPR